MSSLRLQRKHAFIIIFISQLQFTFNIILFWVQVYSMVVRQTYTLQSVPPNISSTHLAPFHSYYRIINDIPYAVLFILITIL